MRQLAILADLKSRPDLSGDDVRFGPQLPRWIVQHDDAEGAHPRVPRKRAFPVARRQMPLP
jgi:hypothetical protein